MLKKIVFIMILGFLAGINAHDLVILKSKTNKFEAKFGHTPKFDSYDPKQLLGATAFDENANPIKTGINYNFDNNKTPEILTQKSPTIITASFSTGNSIQTNGKRIKNTDKSEIKDIIFATTKSIKINKTYLSWNPNLIKPVGLKFELIALNDPFKAKPGDILPILVLKDGKILANAEFYTKKDEPKIRSNEFGIALYPIKQKGLQMITASFKEQIFEENANLLNLTTTIAFEIK